MPTTQVVTQLIVDASGAKQGVADFEASMARAKAAAVDGGETTASSFEKAQRRWTAALGATDPVIKAQIQMQDALAKQQLIGNQAVTLGIATQAAAASQLDRVRAKYQEHVDAAQKASAASTAFGQAMTGVNGQLIALSAGAGPVGTFLAALGPWGLVAAAGIGVLSAAFEEAQRTAHLLAAEAIQLEKFTETTGLSTDTLQALTQAAAKHGVSAEDATGAIVRFTQAWAEAREGGGSFLTQLQKINPSLADQIQRTKDSATAFEIMTKAIQQADAAGNIAQRNLLLRAAGGRGGVVSLTGLSAAVGEAGGLGNLTDDAVKSGEAINGQLLKAVQTLQVQIDDTKKHADLLFGTIGAKPILESELAWQKLRVSIAQASIELTNSEKSMTAWQKFMSLIGRGGVEGGGQGGLLDLRVPTPPGANDNYGIPLPAYPPQLDLSGVNVPAAPKDIKAQLSDLKEQITLLGSSATANDRLKLKLLELQSALDGNKTAENQLAAARGMSAATLDAYIEKLGLHNAAMGASASTTDVVAAKMATLQKQQMQGAGLTAAQIENQRRVATEQANGTAGILQQTDALRIQAGSLGMSAGAAAQYNALQNLLAQDARTGKVATEADTAARVAAAKALGDQAAAFEKLKVANDIQFQQGTVFLGPADVAIAQQLRGIYGNDITAALNSSEAAALRVLNVQKDMVSAAQNFGSTFLTALASGKNGMDALIAAAGQLGTAMMSIGSKNLTGGLTQALSGGGLGGFDPASLAIGGVGMAISYFTSAEQQRKAADEQQAKAWQAWQAAAEQLRVFVATSNGQSAGSLQTAVAQNEQQGTQLEQLRAAAIGDAGAFWDPVIAQLDDAMAAFKARTIAEFQRTFSQSIDEFNANLGSSSTFAQAVAAIKTEGDSLKSFVADAAYAFGAGAPQVAQATAAVESYALTLIGTAPALSDTATKLQTIHGNAQALQTVLTDLGMASSDAAALIQSGVTAAIGALRDSFTSDLQSQINDANGQSYINDIVAAIAARSSNVADLASVGGDISLADTLFQATVQKTIDGAGLVGDAFNALIAQFPQLTGVVHESTTALQAAQDALNQGAKSVVDYVHGLLTGASSPLSPGDQLASAQLGYQTKLGLAQGGNADALSSITTDADAVLKAAQAVFGSSAGYQQIFSSITSQLLNLPAVQATTDPVVQATRDVTAAVVAGNATLLTAVQATTGSVNVNNSLVGTGNTIGNTQAATLAIIQGYTNATQANTASQVSLAATQNSLISTANTLQTSANSLITSSNSLLNAIVTLNNTQVSTLSLLNSQFNIGSQPVTISFRDDAAHWQSQPGAIATITAQNSMLDALNKIVANTFITAMVSRGFAGALNAAGTFPVFASGGLISGPGTGTSDSIMTRVSNGEFVVTADAVSRIGVDVLNGMNAGGMPATNVIPFPMQGRGAANSNSPDYRELLQELRDLRREVAALRGDTRHGAAVVRDGVDNIVTQNQNWQNEDRKSRRSMAGTAGRGSTK